ncbi:MAG: OmpA family protein [Desulfobulbus sp.]|nr:OmpA family protein [Desulfobulbus sp.]
MPKKTINLGLLLLGLAMVQSASATTEIREERYQYHQEKIIFKPGRNFIITSEQRAANHAHDITTTEGSLPLLPGQLKPRNTAQSSTDECALPVPHFALDSALITSSEKASLLRGLQSCHIDKVWPVNVTGHTCILGTEAHNYQLSMSRAEAVATLLRQNGYKIGEVRGKGSEEPVAENSNLELNRRVVITQ